MIPVLVLSQIHFYIVVINRFSDSCYIYIMILYVAFSPSQVIDGRPYTAWN